MPNVRQSIIWPEKAIRVGDLWTTSAPFCDTIDVSLPFFIELSKFDSQT
jgi:hypothetical protein